MSDIGEQMAPLLWRGAIWRVVDTRSGFDLTFIATITTILFTATHILYLQLLLLLDAGKKKKYMHNILLQLF